MSVNPRIIIIGAGPAGYAAACKLLENNFNNIRILEAENRIGGRINSVEFGAGMVDLGAQWCHGEKNNIVYDMVKDLNLLSPSQNNYTEFLFVNSNGTFVDSSISNKLIELLNEIADDEDQLKQQPRSFGEYIKTAYNEKLQVQYPDIDRKLAAQILDFFFKIQCNLNGSLNCYEISAKGLIDYEECEGNQTLHWRDKGYKTIFSVLKKELPDETKKLPVDEKIHFNKEVVKINWGHKDKTSGVTVECKDGSSYSADHVILTVSLGVLKENQKTLFVPDLPESKRIAIHGLGFGIVNKIWLKFPKKWWPDECVGFDLIWSEGDSKTLIYDFPEGPSEEGKSWLESIFGFFPIDSNPNVLLGWYNGEISPEIEKMSDEMVKKGCMYLLKRFLGNHYDIPNPDAILRSSWYSNSHFRGSYSFRSVQSVSLGTGAAVLAEPLAGDALLFAGEATHHQHYSTVHGAIASGYREATRIIHKYKSEDNTKSKL